MIKRIKTQVPLFALSIISEMIIQQLPSLT